MSLVDLISVPQKYTFDARSPALLDEPPFADALIVAVDVTMSESYAFEFEVSDNPVEEGINIADHKRRKPNALSMSGIVSDSPNDLLDVFAGNVSDIVGGTTRSQEAYKKLIEIASRSDPIRVVTRLDVFDNMTFTAFNITKDDSGKYLGFTASLKEIRFAKPLFGTFAPDVKHTAPVAASALKTPPVLDNTSALRAAEVGGDAAIASTPLSVSGKVSGALVGFFKGLLGIGGGVVP